MAPSAPSPSQSPPATAPPPQSPPSPPPPKKSPPPPKSSPPSPPPKSDGSPPSPSKDGGDDDSSSSPPPPATSTVIPSRSPPPPKSAVAPSSNNNYSSSEKSPSPSGPNASLVIIVGVAAGAALLLIIMSLLFLACNRKKKKQKQNINTYYGGTGPSPDSKVGKEYYMYAKPPFQQQQNNNWVKATPDHNNVIKIQKTPSSQQVSLTTTSQSIGLSALPNPSTSSGEVISTATAAASHHPHHHHHHHRSSSSMAPNYNLGKSQSRFSYEELAAATGDFAETNILGQGGFGHVFKGVLPDGKEVAVKTLKSGSGQGDREFQAEVDIITRVHHRYLVSLVGYCIDGPKRILVYEFVPNKTLEYHLHANDRPVMDWPTRIKIALGSAKGIAYLHEDCHPRIIHRDIKASNILLEYNFEAKVSDFGLAKLTSDNNTHVSTRVMGTFGYLAPEYASSGKLTEKSDTFSFGVMLLELITGRRPVDSSSNDMMEDSLVDWARPLIDHALATGDYSQLVDPRLQGNYVPQELASMVACAAACTRHSARRRPKMSQVVRALEGDLSLDVINSWNKQKQEGSSGDYGATSSYSSTD